MRGTMRIAIACLLILCSCSKSEKASHPDAAKIRASNQAYVEAFNRKDPKALAKLFAEDAALIHPESGMVLEGPQAVEDYLRAFLAELGDAKIALEVKSILFPKADLAIEEGTSTLTRKGQDPEVSSYRAYYEKQKGEWLLVEVEEPIQEAHPATEQLRALNWLIGTWIDDDKEYDITSSSQWDDHKKFILQKFSIVKNNLPIREGVQTIGWDPIKGVIRSWIFDSAGGFGEGVWTKQGDSWIVQTSFTLPNGARASSMNVYSHIGPNSYTWQSAGREVSGELHPDIPPITVTRQK